MYLCVVSLSSHDGSAHQQLRVLQNMGQGECEYVRQQEKERARGGERVFASDKEVK